MRPSRTAIQAPFVGISPANFIVNLGKADSQSVQDLIKVVSEKVYSNSGVKLERELQFYHEAFLNVA